MKKCDSGPKSATIRALDAKSTSTSSPSTFAALSKWLDTCMGSHEICRPFPQNSGGRLGWLPTRLIQIDGSPARSSLVRLIESADNPTILDNRYATLSYCWGPPPITFKRLLTTDLISMKAGIEIGKLPKTFQHAIEATTRLGLSLIWIDALCIIQDSEEDWKVESMMMSQVYSCGYVNLAAAASPDAYGGLFRDRYPFSMNPIGLEIKWPGYLTSCAICVPTDPWKSGVNQSPLLRRGWVFQERLLSVRTVYFGEDQLYWECGELCASEMYPVGGPWDASLIEKDNGILEHNTTILDQAFMVLSGRIKNYYAILKSRAPHAGVALDSPVFLQVWATILENYTRGCLTFDRDRLVAISGVARQLCNGTKEESYILGLWRSYFPQLLLWAQFSKETGWRGGHLSSPIGPSWSWASHLHPIRYPSLSGRIRGADIHAQILEIDATPGFAPLAGEQAPTGRLLLKAPMIKAQRLTAGRRALNGPPSPEAFRPQESGRYWAPVGTHDKVVLFTDQESEDEARFYCDANLDGDLDLSEQLDLFLLHVSSATDTVEGFDTHKEFGLLLSPTMREGQYQRVGCFEAYPRSRDTPQSPQHSQESLFRGGNIEVQFHKDVDADGRYTVEIV